MERLLKIILILGTLVFVFLSILRPIDDPDLWWHLKTGEYIAGNGLPERDPFAFTNPNIPEPREKVILTGYWLSQLIYHWTYEVMGLQGFILLRAVLLGLMYWSVLSRMRKSGGDGFGGLIVCCLSLISFLSFFRLDRPQAFSFLFFSLLMGLVESAGEGKRPSWLLIPLMAIWANFHGGVIIGDAVLGLFAVGRLAEHRASPRVALPGILWAGAGIVASLVNPNSYHLFSVALGVTKGAFAQHIVEYQDALTAFGGTARWQVVFYWILLALTMAQLVHGRGRPFWQSAVTVFAGAMSFFYIRNIPFLSIGLAPMAAAALSRGLRTVQGRLLPSLLFRGAAVLLLSLPLWRYSEAALRQGSLKQRVGEFYPSAAADFIETSGISGNMLNDYDWGGYLIWRLYPLQKVFIDGRGIYPAVFDQYMAVFQGDTTPVIGLPAWKAYLEAYRVDFIIMQLYRQHTGQFQPLMVNLMRDPEWRPVYLDSRAFVFVRDSERNRQAISRYAVGKEVFKTALLRQVETMEKNSGTDPRVFIMKGEALWFLGRYGEAEQAYMRALQLSPGNETALFDLKIMRESARGRSGK